MRCNAISNQVSAVVSAINDRPEDAPDLYDRLHAMLETMRREGEEVPSDVARLERELEVERHNAAQGR